MMYITPLGAGQDVGRSCLIITINGYNIMVDCGMHMGFDDERRFPDFSFISQTGHFNQKIDAVIVTHFHLDHCGALPYFTEMCGYDGPIFMTHPTKAICPLLLEDFRKITADRVASSQHRGKAPSQRPKAGSTPTETEIAAASSTITTTTAAITTTTTEAKNGIALDSRSHAKPFLSSASATVSAAPTDPSSTRPDGKDTIEVPSEEHPSMKHGKALHDNKNKAHHRPSRTTTDADADESRSPEREAYFFTTDMIKACMKKVTPMNVNQTIHVTPDLSIRAYYAGHVVGAGMFLVRSGGQSFVYTGDYNMTPDRHLASAFINDCRPDALITETTYATTVRASKKGREEEFLQKIRACVDAGGKVLIPVFALGRAQELCLLVEQYWEEAKLNVPVYFSAGMTSRANDYYKLFINWTNETIKSTFTERNVFDFKHVKPFEKSFANDPGPMVLFASPGMLHAGSSLDVFKKWAHDPKNTVILPGYCVPRSVGAKVLRGDKEITLDEETTVKVNLQVQNLSFSAHADQKGILQLIRDCRPRNVVLVHGEKAGMQILKKKIKEDLAIPAYDPANGQTLCLETVPCLDIQLSPSAIAEHQTLRRVAANLALPTKTETQIEVAGHLRMSENEPLTFCAATEDWAASFACELSARLPLAKAWSNATSLLQRLDDAFATLSLAITRPTPNERRYKSMVFTCVSKDSPEGTAPKKKDHGLTTHSVTSDHLGADMGGDDNELFMRWHLFDNREAVSLRSILKSGNVNENGSSVCTNHCPTTMPKSEHGSATNQKATSDDALQKDNVANKMDNKKEKAHKDTKKKTTPSSPSTTKKTQSKRGKRKRTTT